MRGIYEVIKNNIRRTISKKAYFIISLSITCISIIFAIYFTSKFEIIGNIGIMTRAEFEGFDNPYFKVTVLEDMPPMSALIMNKYDAVLTFKENGEFDVYTIKNQEFKSRIESAILNPESLAPSLDQARGIGANIVGYLTMFILLQGLLFMTFFVEDKENSTLKRSVTTPLSMGSYLVGNGVYNFIMMYIPTLLVLAALREVLKVDIGFTYKEYAGFLVMISGLSTAFALFMCTVIEKHDNAMTLSSSIIVLTSILSGSFYELNNKNQFLKFFTDMLPQRSFLTWVQGIESGKQFTDFLPQVGYMSLLILIFFITGIIICKKRFREGCY